APAAANFGLRGGGDRAAIVEQRSQFFVACRIQMHAIVPALQQALALERDIAAGDLARAAMGMRARPDTKLVGKPEILAADFEGRIFRPEKAKRQRDPCIVGIVDAAQADRLLARVRYLGE